MIGALAAVGLAATGDDGRVIQFDGWQDELSDRSTCGADGEGVAVLQAGGRRCRAGLSTSAKSCGRTAATARSS